MSTATPIAVPTISQLSADGRLHHLWSIDGLNRQYLLALLDRAEQLAALAHAQRQQLLDGRVVVNLFFEPSTRTRTSFELASKRLGAEVIDFDVARSSANKGEILIDTASTLAAMDVDAFVVRSSEMGVAKQLASHADAQQIAVVNAGDGSHAHPTQALLDMLTIRQQPVEFSQLKVAIVGDIRHSRVARSDLAALQMLGVGQVALAAPAALLPTADEFPGVERFDQLEPALREARIVIALRLQKERMEQALIPDRSDYFKQFGLTESRLVQAHPDCQVMHPGPFNREVEIASELVDGPRSLIWPQVRNGVAVRMAVLEALLNQ